MIFFFWKYAQKLCKNLGNFNIFFTISTIFFGGGETGNQNLNEKLWENLEESHIFL